MIQGKLLADFSSFVDACARADVSLKSLDVGAGKVGAALNRMVDTFSGRKLIQDATLAAEAVDRIGGVTRLTETELQKLGAQASDAASKLRAMGVDVPEKLQKIATAAAQAAKQTGLAASASGALKSSFLQLTSAFTAANLIDRAVSSVIGLGHAAIQSANDLVRMRNQTGLSLDTLQRFQAVAADTGGTLDGFTTAAFNLGTALEGGGVGVVAAVKSLGLELRALQALNPDEQFQAIARALEAIEDPQQRNLAALQLFGKSAKEILPAIAEGYTAIAAAARVSSDAQITAINAAANRWDTFVHDAKTAAASFLGDMLIARDTLKTLTNEQLSTFRALQKSGGDGQQFLLDLAKAAATAGKDINLAIKPLVTIAKAHTEAQKAAAAHAREIQALSDRLYGRGLIAAAKDLVQALGPLPDLNKVSAAEIKNIHVAMTEALDVFTRTGKVAPKAMIDLWVATRQAEPVIVGLTKAFADMGRAVDVLADTKLPKIPQAIQGIGPAFGTIGQQVDLLPPKVDKLERHFDELARSLAQLSQIAGGTFGTIARDLATLVSALDVAQVSTTKMRAGFDQLSGSNQNIAAGLTTIAASALSMSAAFLQATASGNTLSKTLKGAAVGAQVGSAFGPIGTAIGAGVGAIAGLFRGLSGTAGRDLVRTFADAQGGFDKLHRSLGVLGAEGERMWISLTQGVGRNNADQARRAIEQVQAALGTVPAGLNALLTAALTTGQAIQTSMAPLLQDLIEMGGLTEANKNLLLGLPAAGVPSFDDVAAAAERLGVDLDVIGQSIQQLKLTDTAASVADDLDILARAGADMNAVLDLSGGKLQQVVNDAQRMGLSLPEKLKPFLQQMVDAGDLTDIFGTALTDLDDLHFTQPLEDSIQDLIDAMRELVGVITNEVGGAFDDLSRVRMPRFDPGGGVRDSSGDVLDPFAFRGGGRLPSAIQTRVVFNMNARQFATAMAEQALNW